MKINVHSPAGDSVMTFEELFASRFPSRDPEAEQGFRACVMRGECPGVSLVLPSIEALAAGFVAVLREWLKPSELAEIVARNAVETDSLVCHTHDFCDANMAMHTAFERLAGFDPLDTRTESDIMSDECGALWSAAWDAGRVLLADAEKGKIHLHPAGIGAALDAKAEEIARGTGSLEGVEIYILVHAARYAGEGWSETRRAEIVRHLRPLLIAGK